MLTHTNLPRQKHTQLYIGIFFVLNCHHHYIIIIENPGTNAIVYRISPVIHVYMFLLLTTHCFNNVFSVLSFFYYLMAQLCPCGFQSMAREWHSILRERERERERDSSVLPAARSKLSIGFPSFLHLRRGGSSSMILSRSLSLSARENALTLLILLPFNPSLPPVDSLSLISRWDQFEKGL